MEHSFFNIYLYIYISIYILKKERNVLRSFAKKINVLAFFYILCKRTLHSLLSFTFFAKERYILCVLLGFISHQKLKKRTEKNVAFFKRTEKNGTFRTEKIAVPNLGIAASKVSLQHCFRGMRDTFLITQFFS